MDTVRAAVIGLGSWGGMLASAAQRSAGIDVVACFSRRAEARERFAAAHGCAPAGTLEEVLANPEIEAVLIATPHSHHREAVESAASAGKHIFVDKPLTLTVEDGKGAIAAASRNGVVLQVGHNRRRRLPVRRIRGLIDQGQLGMVHHLESTHTTPRFQHPPASWRVDPRESPLGGMTGLGVHTIDTFHYLAGPIAQVTGYSRRLLGRSDLDDATAVLFEFESGALGYLGTSLVVPRRVELRVYGTAAAAWSEDDGSRLFVQPVDEDLRREEPVEDFDDLRDQLEEFACCIRTGDVPETGGAEGLAVVSVLQAVIESVTTRRSVTVDAHR